MDGQSLLLNGSMVYPISAPPQTLVQNAGFGFPLCPQAAPSGAGAHETTAAISNEKKPLSERYVRDSERTECNRRCHREN